MIRRPTISRLIDSALGELSVKLINKAEQHCVSDTAGDIRKKLFLLQSAINASPVERATSPAFTKKLKAILKSAEIEIASEFIVFASRKYPRLMVDLISDGLISARVRHIYRIANIGSCLSKENLMTLNAGIAGVRRRVFEISSSSGEDLL